MNACSTCSSPVKKKAAEVKFVDRQEAFDGHNLKTTLSPSPRNKLSALDLSCA